MNTPIHFRYNLPNGPVLEFNVNPDSHPPTNMHVLIGHNGSGKSIYIRGIAEQKHPFTNLVTVSFSAFNPFAFLNPSSTCESIGLVGTIPDTDLPKELDILGLDPVFKEGGPFSIGHKIVLYVLTRLIDLVGDKTLVLLHEPEVHLHPTLISLFIRCLSDLLVRRNAMAIISTHSPVVLQEVPKECVWMFRRAGQSIRVERPRIETFGENIGILMSDVLGLEVTRSGFYQLLEEAVEETGDYQKVLARFGGQLGMEARAIVRGLLAAG